VHRIKVTQADIYLKVENTSEKRKINSGGKTNVPGDDFKKTMQNI
jgi:hypothetical protein